MKNVEILPAFGFRLNISPVWSAYWVLFRSEKIQTLIFSSAFEVGLVKVVRIMWLS